MSQVRFIGDLHFSHVFMADHRKFQDTFYHDEHIIDMWNRTVHKKDLTFILGDISIGNNNAYKLLPRLKGRKVVILGNHDPRQYTKDLLKYVDQVAGVIKYKGFFVTHIPIHPTEFTYGRQEIHGNIHAHTHENTIDDYHYICVSAEQIDYKPITFDRILEIFNQNKPK